MTLLTPDSRKQPITPALELAPMIVLFDLTLIWLDPRLILPETVMIMLVLDSAAVLKAAAVDTVVDEPDPPVVPAANPLAVATVNSVEGSLSLSASPR